MCTLAEIAEICDQILTKFWPISLNFELTLDTIFAKVANFHCCKWPNIEKI